MKLNNLVVEVLLDTEWTAFEVINNMSVTQVVNPFEGRSTDSNISFSFKYNETLYNYLISHKSVYCNVVFNDTEVFTGVIENKFNVTRTNLPPHEIAVTVVSLTYLLRKKYKIIKKYNNKSVAYIISDLLGLVNMMLTSTPAVFTSTVLTRTFDLSKKPPLEIIETLAYECSYVFYADSFLKLNCKPIKQNTPVDVTFNENQILDRVALSINDKQADEVDTKYYELQTFSDMICCEDVTNQNSMYRCYVPIAAGGHYQDNESGVYFDLIYTKEGKSFDIFNITDATLVITKDNDISVLEQYLTDDNRYFVKIKNTGATTKYIYKLQVKCTGQIKTSTNVKKTAFGGGDTIKEYEMQYIQSSASAAALTDSLAQLYKYSGYVVEFNSYNNLDLLTKVKLNNVYGIGSVYCAITKKQYKLELNRNCVYEYAAIAINEIEEFEVTTEQTIHSNPTNIDIINTPQVPTTDNVLMGEEGTESIVFTDEDDDDVVLRLAQENTDKGKYLAIQKLYKDGLLFKDYGNLRLKKLMLEEMEVQQVGINNVSSGMLAIKDTDGNLSSINVNSVYIHSNPALYYDASGKIVVDDNVYKNKYNINMSSPAYSWSYPTVDTQYGSIIFGNYVVYVDRNTRELCYYLKTSNNPTIYRKTGEQIANNTNYTQINVMNIRDIGDGKLYIILNFRHSGKNQSFIIVYYTTDLSTFTMRWNMGDSWVYAAIVDADFVKIGNYLWVVASPVYTYSSSYIRKLNTDWSDAGWNKFRIGVNYCRIEKIFNSTQYVVTFDHYNKKVRIMDLNDSFKSYKEFYLPYSSSILLRDLGDKLRCINPSATSNQIFTIATDCLYGDTDYNWKHIIVMNFKDLNTVAFDYIPLSSYSIYSDNDYSVLQHSLNMLTNIKTESNSTVNYYNISSYFSSPINSSASGSASTNLWMLNSDLTIKRVNVNSAGDITTDNYAVINNVIKVYSRNSPNSSREILVVKKTDDKIYIYITSNNTTITYTHPTQYSCSCGFNCIGSQNYILMQLFNSNFSISANYLINISNSDNDTITSVKSISLNSSCIAISINEIVSGYLLITYLDTISHKIYSSIFDINNNLAIENIYLSLTGNLITSTANNIWTTGKTLIPTSSNTMKQYNVYTATITTEVVKLGYGIIETGSNSNGSWVKFSNGFTIAQVVQQTSITIPNQYGSSHVYCNNITLNLPKTFSSVTGVSYGKSQWSSGASWGYIHDQTYTTVTFRVLDAFARTSLETTYFMATVYGYS